MGEDAGSSAAAADTLSCSGITSLPAISASATLASFARDMATRAHEGGRGVASFQMNGLAYNPFVCTVGSPQAVRQDCAPRSSVSSTSVKHHL